MGPPRRPVTREPHSAAAYQGSRGGSRPTPSRRAARTQGFGAGSTGAGGGAVSRRNCSIAASTAAASSGEADEPCSSRRGRRFISVHCGTIGHLARPGDRPALVAAPLGQLVRVVAGRDRRDPVVPQQTEEPLDQLLGAGLHAVAEVPVPVGELMRPPGVRLAGLPHADRLPELALQPVRELHAGARHILCVDGAVERARLIQAGARPGDRPALVAAPLGQLVLVVAGCDRGDAVVPQEPQDPRGEPAALLDLDPISEEQEPVRELTRAQRVAIVAAFDVEPLADLAREPVLERGALARWIFRIDDAVDRLLVDQGPGRGSSRHRSSFPSPDHRSGMYGPWSNGPPRRMIDMSTSWPSRRSSSLRSADSFASPLAILPVLRARSRPRSLDDPGLGRPYPRSR